MNQIRPRHRQQPSGAPGTHFGLVSGLSPRLSSKGMPAVLLVAAMTACTTGRGALEELAHLYPTQGRDPIEEPGEIENPSRVALGDLAVLRTARSLSVAERLEAVVLLVKAARTDPVPVVRADATRTLSGLVHRWRAQWGSPTAVHDPDVATASLQTVVATGRVLSGAEGLPAGGSRDGQPDAAGRLRDLRALERLGEVRMPGEGGLETTVRLVTLLGEEARKRPDPDWQAVARGAARGLACHALYLLARLELGDGDIEVRTSAAEALLALDPAGSLDVVFSIVFPAVEASANPVRENEARSRVLRKLAATGLSAEQLSSDVRSRLAALLSAPDPALSRAAILAARSLLGLGEAADSEQLAARLLAGPATEAES